jgi:hypothetical protein
MTHHHYVPQLSVGGVQGVLSSPAWEVSEVPLTFQAVHELIVPSAREPVVACLSSPRRHLDKVHLVRLDLSSPC